VDNISLARIATVTGVYGVSFEIMVVNAALAAAFLLRRDKRKPLLLAALGAAVVLQATRWISPPPVPTDRTALLVQQNIPILEGADWTKEYFDGTLRDLSWISLSAAGLNPQNPNSGAKPQHPNLIAWPESPAPFYSNDPVFRDAVANLAREADTWVIVGNLGVGSGGPMPERAAPVYNSASLVSPSGDWVARYSKVHLVPFGEYVPFRRLFSFAGGLTEQVGTFTAGHSREPLQADGTKLGVFICYESIFPDEVRQFAANGAQVFVNISNDGWYGDSGAYAQHLEQARMRAVENRRWLLRDTNTGVTASIDPYGRIVATVPRKVRTVLQAPYALTNVTTFYTLHGDWFAYLCAIISVVALFTRLLFREKAERES
jgi:apolipoprotein N-acyltransferase